MIRVISANRKDGGTMLRSFNTEFILDGRAMQGTFSRGNQEGLLRGAEIEHDVLMKCIQRPKTAKPRRQIVRHLRPRKDFVNSSNFIESYDAREGSQEMLETVN